MNEARTTYVEQNAEPDKDFFHSNNENLTEKVSVTGPELKLQSFSSASIF